MTDFLSIFQSYGQLINAGSVLALIGIIFVLMQDRPKSAIPENITGTLVDYDNKFNQIYKQVDVIKVSVDKLNGAGLPKGFYTDINLDMNVEELSPEETDLAIHTLDELQNQNARCLIVLNRNFKSTEAFRAKLYKHSDEQRNQSRPASMIQKPAPKKVDPQAQNLFPNLLQGN